MRVFTLGFIARSLPIAFLLLLLPSRILVAQEPPPASSVSPQSAAEPNLRVEVDSSTEGQTQVIATNVSDVPLTACALSVGSSTADLSAYGIWWDSVYMGLSPLVKDASLTFPLQYIVASLHPNKAVVKAAIWADGTTFGNPDTLERILLTRRDRAQTLDQVISVLRKGLQEDWRRDAYLTALDHESKSVSSLSHMFRATIKATADFDSNLQVRHSTVQSELDSLIKQRDALRQSKPQLPGLQDPAKP
jgi:hypothetical protein